MEFKPNWQVTAQTCAVWFLHASSGLLQREKPPVGCSRQRSPLVFILQRLQHGCRGQGSLMSPWPRKWPYQMTNARAPHAQPSGRKGALWDSVRTLQRPWLSSAMRRPVPNRCQREMSSEVNLHKKLKYDEMKEASSSNWPNASGCYVI